MAKTVVIVSGESRHREALAEAVRRSGRRAQLCATAGDAKRLLLRDEFVAVLCEDTLPGGDFTSVVSEIERLGLNVPVIVVSRRDDWDSFMVALAAGATDYVAFPPYPGEVQHSLAKAEKLSASLASVG